MKITNVSNDELTIAYMNDTWLCRKTNNCDHHAIDITECEHIIKSMFENNECDAFNNRIHITKIVK